MGFFDSVNPFKKKDDVLPPLDDLAETPGQPNLDHSQLSQQPTHPNIAQQPIPEQQPNPSFEPQQQELSDSRMKMPLGDSIRQQRVSAMHGSDETHNPIQHNPLQKELELISSKLDYLKASIDAANQRLAHLEHLTKEEIESKKW